MTVTLTDEQCIFLKAIAGTGREGLKVDMSDFRINNMALYFRWEVKPAYILPVGKPEYAKPDGTLDYDKFVITSAGEAAIEEHERRQKQGGAVNVTFSGNNNTYNQTSGNGSINNTQNIGNPGFLSLIGKFFKWISSLFCSK